MFIFKTGDIDPSLTEYYKFISIMQSNQSLFHCLISMDVGAVRVQNGQGLGGQQDEYFFSWHLWISF